MKNAKMKKNRVNFIKELLDKYGGVVTILGKSDAGVVEEELEKL